MRYRGRPPLNRQNHTNSCWAAALASFSRVTADVSVRTETTLCMRYGNAANAYGLTSGGLERLRTDLDEEGVKIDLVEYLQMPYDLEDRLAKSHIVLAWCLGGTDWHANLVYGVDNSTVAVMETRDGSYRERRWGYYTSPRGFYLMWKP